MKKFNEFENWFIVTSLEKAIAEAEEMVVEAEKEGKRPIYAAGYFTMVGGEIIDKVNEMSRKKRKQK